MSFLESPVVLRCGIQPENRTGLVSHRTKSGLSSGHEVQLMPVATVPPRAQVMATTLAHDARTVHDTASLQLSEFEMEGHANWIVADISPGARSGSATLPGASYDAKTRQLVAPPGTQTVVIKEGTWKAIASSPNEAQNRQGEYNWSEPLAQRSRVLLPEDFYSPFVSGGTILFRPTWSENNRAQFGVVCLLFSMWTKDVSPAFTFAEKHPGLLGESTPSSPDAGQLRKGVLGSNKLVAALSFRQMLLLGLLTPEGALDDLSGANENLDAIYVYLILTNATLDKDRRLVATIDSLARTSQEPAKLRAISLGAFAAALFWPRDPNITSQSKSVLSAVSMRLKRLTPSPPEDPYLLYLFEQMGIAP